MIYEVTVFVNNNIAQSYETYMAKHIQDVVNTGCFVKAEWRKIISQESEDTGFVMSYEYLTDEHFERYSKEYAAALQAEHTALWKGQFTASRRMLCYIQTFINKKNLWESLCVENNE